MRFPTPFLLSFCTAIVAHGADLYGNMSGKIITVSSEQRQFKQSFSCVLIIATSFCFAGKSFAADKTSIELACGDSKAAITCQKFKNDVCVESQLAFDTKDGKHIIPTYQPPQSFVVPTIADGLQCETGMHDGVPSLCRLVYSWMHLRCMFYN